MVKAAKAIAALLLAGFFISATPADYLTSLRTLEGTPYYKLNCARYIEKAKRARHCGAAGMFNGCDGQMEVIAQFATKDEIDPSYLRAGDVLDFNGVHVVAFVGDGFMDSDPEHDGVATIDLRTKSRFDHWFQGPVRIVRWK